MFRVNTSNAFVMILEFFLLLSVGGLKRKRGRCVSHSFIIIIIIITRINHGLLNPLRKTRISKSGGPLSSTAVQVILYNGIFVLPPLKTLFEYSSFLIFLLLLPNFDHVTPGKVGWWRTSTHLSFIRHAKNRYFLRNLLFFKKEEENALFSRLGGIAALAVR